MSRSNLKGNPLYYFSLQKYIFPGEILYKITPRKISKDFFIFIQGCKDFFSWEFFVKWTLVKTKGKSYIFFSRRSENIFQREFHTKWTQINFHGKCFIFSQEGQKKYEVNSFIKFPRVYFVKWSSLPLR